MAATPGPVRTISGIDIVATRSFHDFVDGLDTLVVAGGIINSEQACKDPALVEWVRSIAPRARRVAFAPAHSSWQPRASCYRRVTTHWMFSDVLATEYPSIQVDSSLLFARDGNIYTSGGITAGIDLALALVAAARMMVVFPAGPGGNPNSAPIM
jgi:transcriptional regulator GlxA family with amidase domain